MNSREKGREKLRGESLTETPELPDVGPYAYLIDLLLEVGPTNLTWSDLEAWNRLLGWFLNHWELRMIHRLGVVFTGAKNEYEGTKAVSPFVPSAPIEKIEQSIKDSLRQPLNNKGVRKQ